MWIYCIPHTDMIPSMKTSSLILGIASFCVNTSVMSPKTMKRIGKIAPVIIANTLWTLISPKVIISIQDTKNTKNYHLNKIFFVELTYLRGNQADLITCSPMHTSYWRKNWPKTVYVEKKWQIWGMCSPRRKRGEACQFCHETCTARPPQPKYNIILKKTKRAHPAQPNYKYNTSSKRQSPTDNIILIVVAIFYFSIASCLIINTIVLIPPTSSSYSFDGCLVLLLLLLAATSIHSVGSHFKLELVLSITSSFGNFGFLDVCMASPTALVAWKLRTNQEHIKLWLLVMRSVTLSNFFFFKEAIPHESERVSND